jgi:uncharacterized protein (TIGR03435 family)
MRLKILLCILIGVPGSFSFSQTLSFEVASIKPNNSVSFNSGTRTTEHSLSSQNVTAKRLIEMAYRVQSFQVIGGPDWMDSSRFDIEAKPPANVILNSDTIPKMILSMLEERFQLKAHRETRELPVYALVAGRDMTKLKTPVEGKDGPGGDAGSISINGSRNKVEIRASAISLAGLASALGNQLDRTVIDRTNIAGVYDVVLSWSPQPTVTSEQPGPTVFTALQEQLGLKLESAKGPVEVIVIDSVQKPSDN